MKQWWKAHEQSMNRSMNVWWKVGVRGWSGDESVINNQWTNDENGVCRMCKWWNWSVWDVQMMKLECVGCGGSAPLGIWLIIYIYILLCAFECWQCVNDVQMRKMICAGSVRCVGLGGDEQMMKMECVECANDEIGVCGMWGKCAPRDLFIYVLLWMFGI